MRLSIVGTGYVGLVSGVCLAAIGHEVILYDNDSTKIAALEQGIIPIFEPGLEALLAQHKQRIKLTTRLVDALEAEALFLCVGTPTIKATGEADLQYVFAAAEEIIAKAQKPLVLVTKSTVPIGTNRKLSAMFQHHPITIASNPEFLREGSAMEDFMQPDRIVIGGEDEQAIACLAKIYEPFAKRGVPFVTTSWESAEMIKYAANTFLAAKVAFINEMADLCERVGADVDVVSHGIGLDPRIGEKFLKAGPGFGGSCFPKDTKALLKIAEQYAMDLPITEAVVSSNETRRHKMVEKIADAFGGKLAGKRIAVLGLTFKPGTNDMRESVSLVILPELVARGAEVWAYDPEGMTEAAKLLPETIRFAPTATLCLQEADGAVLLTEWDEFRTLTSPDFSGLRDKVVIDLRNIYSPSGLPGLRLISVGK